jgi:hypothetical protein
VVGVGGGEWWVDAAAFKNDGRARAGRVEGHNKVGVDCQDTSIKACLENHLLEHYLEIE